MQIDIAIVGQGICGTLLSWFLHKEGRSFVVIDNNDPAASSKIAAGIINPVTGRRFVYTWMIDVLMPFAKSTYKEIGTFLNKELVVQKDIIEFFPSPQMRDAFTTRITEDDTFLHTYPDQNYFNPYFNYEFGCGEICPALIIDMQPLLNEWRKYLQTKNLLREEDFVAKELNISDRIAYKDITAQKIIFCDGINSLNNPFFSMLPFAPNKGEVLIIEAEDLPDNHIFKKGMMLAPLFTKNLFWVGSSYEWEFKTPHPTEKFYKQTKNLLDQWLKVPYKIVDHFAAVRPATIERRPFVGFHPQYQNVGILNGMGTKGTALAPFFAHQLVQNIIFNLPVTDEADVRRFTRILTK
ncbi:MAG: FAD-binding oxidoreductase [Chitinophagaceae bacterium]|nr:FAD-binding oxidoreductase [Chitinophagaceae bacterium]